jgi:MFS family permease
LPVPGIIHLPTQAEPERDTDRRLVVTAFGIAQILGWGTSFYFPAVFAPPIVADTGWSLGLTVSGTSVGLLVGGLISPKVGEAIGRHGGRPVLCASSLLFAAGLTAIALAPNVAIYLLAWTVIGLGMGMGLYDAAFAALGQRYGREARRPITTLTLFGGFASTICWPLSALLIEHTGWRNACLIYAALHLMLVLPLLFAVTGPRKAAADRVTPQSEAPRTPPLPNERRVFILLAAILSIAAGVGSVVIVHFLIFLQSRGVAEAAAVALGTLFGPAQVGARVIEQLFGARYHPIWTMVACCALMALGLALILSYVPWLVLAILLYGAGYGISWIGRGTLPLALFGPERFPTLMGRIAFPSLIVQALAPSAGALTIERFGVDATIALLTGLALINVVLIALLWALCRAQPRTET